MSPAAKEQDSKSPPTTSNDPAQEAESVTRIRDLLQRILRVFISDGRIFIGTFVCTDKARNLILTNTEEFKLGDVQHGRYVGMIMIPWKYILRVEAETEHAEDAQEGDNSERYT